LPAEVFDHVPVDGGFVEAGSRLDTPGAGRYIAFAVGIKVTRTTTTKVMRKGPGGETIVTTTETSPAGGKTTVTTTEKSPITFPCPKCGGEILVPSTICPKCGTNWQGQKHLSFKVQPKITISPGITLSLGSNTMLFILLLLALGGAALIFLDYLK